MADRPTIVISSGDPAGIGPEVTVKALAQPEVRALAEFIVAGDPLILAETAGRLGLAAPHRVLPVPAGDGIRLGQVSAAGGEAGYAAIRAAVDLIRAGGAQALVTAPISKEALRAAGHPWPGHTEMLADLCGVEEVRMLLVAGSLRVAHVTTHRSLRSAIDAATRERVLTTIEIADEGGRRLGLERRRIGVAGLNPHAGENGLFGDEELIAIGPAVEDARRLGIDAIGPLPADTLFWRAKRGEFDLVVAMYHDQGHVAVKVNGFDEGVNVSLGLPFPRTSVDHGTAFDIAGRGIAEWTSMAAAIRLAVAMVRGRSTGTGA